MPQLTEENIRTALSKVIDPDFKKDLVTLNMIEDIKIDGNKIQFKVVLTTPACPLKDHLESECRKYLTEAFGDDIIADIEMTSRTTTLRTVADYMPDVKNIIAVASGKGGVGKSTVAVNLALALARNGAKVGLMDADIYGPSIPIMFDLENKRPKIQTVDGKHKIIPIEKYGVKLVSIGFLVEPSQAVVWRGPMVSSAIKQFVTDVIWGELDYLLIDLPPGTGDIHLSIVSMAKPSGAVIVTTPQDVALADAKKAIDMFRNPQINVPVLGVIENMSYFIPPDMPEKKYYIFGKDGGKLIAGEFDTTLLGQLPLTEKIRTGGDDGEPVVLKPKSPAGKAFLTTADEVIRQVAIKNASHEMALAE